MTESKKDVLDPLPPTLVIFKDSEFRGDKWPLNDSIPDLNWIGFNDCISSIVVDKGTWQFYVDSNYQTPCGDPVGPGQWARLDSLKIPDDKVSSANAAPAAHFLMG